MGGGGGINPIPIIATLVFGPEAGGLVGTVMVSRHSGRSGSDDGAAQAAAAAQAAGRAAEETAAAERRREDRKRQEAVLLGQVRAAQRAGLAGANAQAQTLGQPVVETSQLKEKLGQ